MREADLYQPIKQYLTGLGYEVRAEIKHCDIAATRDDKLLVVELKTSANLTLLVQAMERSAHADTVFVAIPEPEKPNRHFRGFTNIVAKLGLGLITVRFSPAGPSVQLHVDPASTAETKPARRQKRGKGRAAIMEEFNGRSGDYNVGGSRGEPVLTAYRENAIFVACCLKAHGPMSPARIRKLGADPKAPGILAKNYYGWFNRVKRGVYSLTPAGVAALKQYPELSERCFARINPEPT